MTPETRRAIGYGARRRCPRCGEGRLFASAMSLRESCDHCGLRFVEGSGDLWAFLYLSTAGLTGVVIIAMLLIRPASLLGGRFVLATAAALLIVGTLPLRKGIGVAIDYLLRAATDAEPEPHPAPRPEPKPLSADPSRPDVVSEGRESV